MKLTNLKKLILQFKGGGKINLTPLSKLIKVDIESDEIDDGGGEPDFDKTIDDFVYILTKGKVKRYDDLPVLPLGDYNILEKARLTADDGKTFITADITCTVENPEINDENPYDFIYSYIITYLNLNLDDIFLYDDRICKIADINDKYIQVNTICNISKKHKQIREIGLNLFYNDRIEYLGAGGGVL